MWYEKLNSLLVQHNYEQAPSDHSLFIKKTTTSFTNYEQTRILMLFNLMLRAGPLMLFYCFLLPLYKQKKTPN